MSPYKSLLTENTIEGLFIKIGVNRSSYHKSNQGEPKGSPTPLRSTKGERSEPVSVAKRGAGGKGDVFPYIHHFIEFIS